jgi:putative ABC transport system permease protein
LGYRDRLGLLAYYPFYLFFAVMVIWIAAVSFLKSHAGLVYTNAPEPKATVPVERKQKGAWLKQILNENHYYEDPELSLVSLSEKLHLTTHELSRIINTVIKKSFSDFINEYRVSEVIRKMRDPAYDHLTLFGIAYDSGFNSKTNFNRAFRQLTGKSAGEYKTGQKKDGPFYNNGLQPVNKPLTLRPEQKSKRNFMFKNYLKIAWRNLLRQRLYSLVNISGLAAGLAVCMLILLYVAHEHSYDRFHQNADRIVKPKGRINVNGNSFDIDKMSYVSGPLIKQSLPVVADYMRTAQYFTSVVLVSNPSQPQRNAISTG